MGIWYTTLEAVKGALDIAETARNDAQVRRAIESGARSIDGTRPGRGRLKRRFYPELATRTFRTISSRQPWQLPLGRYELIEPISIVSGGVTISPGEYVLQPQNDGPPYDQIDLVTSIRSAWPGDTDIEGLWGYRADEEPIGALAAQLGDTSSATASVAWSTAKFGTGDILRIDDERLIIRERTWVDTGQDLGGDGLAVSMADTILDVADGTAFAPEEILLVDAERMRVVDVVGNQVTVIRQWDGTVLAAHGSGADVYALTGVELDRGQLGTTATTHAADAVIYRHIVPGLVGELNLAEAVNTLQQELGAFQRTYGAGETSVNPGLAGLANIRRDAEDAYRRRLTWLGV